MTQKLLCLCVVAALFYAFATVNVASAQSMETIPAPSAAACPCEGTAVPCNWACPSWYAKGCPPVTYRIGLFGAIRPVVYAPVYRPVYVAPRFAPRYVCPPYPVCAPAYAPYCW